MGFPRECQGPQIDLKTIADPFRKTEKNLCLLHVIEKIVKDSIDYDGLSKTISINDASF